MKTIKLHDFGVAVLLVGLLIQSVIYAGGNTGGNKAREIESLKAEISELRG